MQRELKVFCISYLLSQHVSFAPLWRCLSAFHSEADWIMIASVTLVENTDVEEEGIFAWMDRNAVFLIISNKMLPSSGQKHLYKMPSITFMLQKQHCHSDIHQPHLYWINCWLRSKSGWDRRLGHRGPDAQLFLHTFSSTLLYLSCVPSEAPGNLREALDKHAAMCKATIMITVLVMYLRCAKC